MLFKPILLSLTFVLIIFLLHIILTNIPISTTSQVTISAMAIIIADAINIFIIKPIKDFRIAINGLISTLTFYSNRITSPLVIRDRDYDEKELYPYNEASIELRRASINVKGLKLNVPFYNFFSFLKILPKATAIKKACSEIIGISNSLIINEDILECCESNYKTLKNLYKLLNVEEDQF